MANVVRIDYEQMSSIRGILQDQSDSVKQVLALIMDQYEVLRGGAWISESADAFYRVMDDQLLPTLERLITALNITNDACDHVARIFDAAEEEGRGFFPTN